MIYLYIFINKWWILGIFSSIIAFPWTSTMVHGRKVSWTMSLMDALRWLADVQIRPLSLSKVSISGNDYVFMTWTFSLKMHQGLLHILWIWILLMEKSHKFSVFLKHLPNKISLDTWYVTSRDYNKKWSNQVQLVLKR